jgi:hypothetical protein
MTKRWSKLKKEVESLFADNLDLKVYCTDMDRAITARKYNSGEHLSFQSLGNFRVVLDKTELWSFPKDFVKANEPGTWPDGRPYSYTASDINCVIREYIDTPKSELLSKHFKDDLFGITKLFLAADRRISPEKLATHFRESHNERVTPIIEARLSNKSSKKDALKRASS